MDWPGKCAAAFNFANALQCSATVLRWMQTCGRCIPYREESRSDRSIPLMRRDEQRIITKTLASCHYHGGKYIAKLLASMRSRFGASCWEYGIGTYETITIIQPDFSGRKSGWILVFPQDFHNEQE